MMSSFELDTIWLYLKMQDLSLLLLICSYRVSLLCVIHLYFLTEFNKADNKLIIVAFQ